jgi:hypothetical protein
MTNCPDCGASTSNCFPIHSCATNTPKGAGESHDPAAKKPFQYVALLEEGVEIRAHSLFFELSFPQAEQLAFELRHTLDTMKPYGRFEKRKTGYMGDVNGAGCDPDVP